MTCRPPPEGKSLDPLTLTWPAGRVIHRIHDSHYAPQTFHPGVAARGSACKPTRFAPICNVHGAAIPYLYGGSTLDCAIFETVFHDVPFDQPDKFVDLQPFARHAHGELLAARDLKLVDLTSEGLHRLRIPKAELIESMARDYPVTALWAQALHQGFPDIDGLLWMSRQRDRDHALLLFGDRASRAVTGKRAGPPLVYNQALLDRILEAAERAGIDVALEMGSPSDTVKE